jgi:integrase
VRITFRPQVRGARWHYCLFDKGLPAGEFALAATRGLRWHTHPSSLDRTIRAAMRRARVGKRVTCHTFRHSFATQLLEAAGSAGAGRDVKRQGDKVTRCAFGAPKAQRLRE